MQEEEGRAGVRERERGGGATDIPQLTAVAVVEVEEERRRVKVEGMVLQAVPGVPHKLVQEAHVGMRVAKFRVESPLGEGVKSVRGTERAPMTRDTVSTVTPGVVKEEEKLRARGRPGYH